jgi:hypothetical protein
VAHASRRATFRRETCNRSRRRFPWNRSTGPCRHRTRRTRHIYQETRCHQRNEIFVRKLVPIIDKKAESGRADETRGGAFLVKSVQFHCRVLQRWFLRTDEAQCMVTDGDGRNSPCLPESVAPLAHPGCTSQIRGLQSGEKRANFGEVHIGSPRHITWPCESGKRANREKAIAECPRCYGFGDSRMVGEWLNEALWQTARLRLKGEDVRPRLKHILACLVWVAQERSESQA